MSGAGGKLLILDRGVVEPAYPRDWTVKANPAGHLELTDPGDSATLGLSYLTARVEGFPVEDDIRNFFSNPRPGTLRVLAQGPDRVARPAAAQHLVKAGLYAAAARREGKM